MFYKFFFRSVLSKLDPEVAHYLAFKSLQLVDKIDFLKILYHFCKPDPVLATQVRGIKFSSPFVLAAGFDKDATAVCALANLGFSGIEVGTITALPQAGNKKPRLFRLVLDKALINRMGFNNGGALAVANRLDELENSFSYKKFFVPPVVGVNIGKTKVVDLDNAVADYVESTKILVPYADYLVVNVSSPNTVGLRQLQVVETLRPLLEAVQKTIVETVAKEVPLFVKISPDLSWEQIDEIACLVTELNLAGIIATNTTTSRQNLLSDANEVVAFGGGGLSGEPLRARSLEVLARLRKNLGENTVLISVGGVNSGQDVYERLQAGASLVQGYTAFVYEGPFWVRKINKQLARLVKGGS